MGSIGPAHLVRLTLPFTGPHHTGPPSIPVNSWTCLRNQTKKKNQSKPCRIEYWNCLSKKPDLPNGVIFQRTHLAVGIFNQIVDMLKQHTPNHFYSPVLLSYVLTGLCDNYQLFKKLDRQKWNQRCQRKTQVSHLTLCDWCYSTKYLLGQIDTWKTIKRNLVHLKTLVASWLKCKCWKSTSSKLTHCIYIFY